MTIKMKVGITGFDELIKGLKNYTVKTIFDMGIQTELSARVIEGTAKVLAPVDTGRLRSSIVIKPIGFNLVKEIVARTNYAVHQEFGTKNQSGKPFMRPAFSQEEPNYVKKIAKILKNGKV